MSTKRCSQCWRLKDESAFIGARGKPVVMCDACRAQYYNWGSKSAAERLAAHPPRVGLDPSSPLRVLFVRKSGNKKTGPIPVSTSSASTCPTTCSFYGAGCYAEFHRMRAHWSRVPERGLTWSDFCAEVSALPPKQLWRHNEAGDLPGEDQRIDSGKLFLLVVANMGRRGFTFTHKPVLGRTSMLRHNRAAVTVANLHGFTVNLSADSLVEADKLAALGVAPVVVVVPSDAPRRLRTPAGRHVVLCPAETHELTCDECRLCASRTRKSIVGFRAHGQMRKHVSELVTLRRSATGKKASA